MRNSFLALSSSRASLKPLYLSSSGSFFTSYFVFRYLSPQSTFPPSEPPTSTFLSSRPNIVYLPLYCYVTHRDNYHCYVPHSTPRAKRLDVLCGLAMSICSCYFVPESQYWNTTLLERGWKSFGKHPGTHRHHVPRQFPVNSLSNLPILYHRSLLPLTYYSPRHYFTFLV